MLLATRCPFCESVFRLRPAQLALRRGLVRCGHCQEVFDASISLFETDESGNFATAEPLEPDVVSRLIAGEAVPSERRPPVTLPVSGPDPVDPLSSEPYLADPRSTGLQASEPHPAEPHFAQPPGAESQLAESHPAGPSSSEPLAAGQTSAPKTAAPHDALADDATQTSHDPHAHEWTQGAPNFKSDAWNPWAPAPDAHIDERLRHSTKNLPYRPLSETAMATLKVAIEREAQQRAVEEAATHVPESGSPTEHEPALSSTANEPNTPHTPPRWRAVEPPPEEQAEPAFAFVPAMASAPAREREREREREPRFGTPAPEPFAAMPPGDGADPFAVTRETRGPEPRRLGWRILGSLVALVLLVLLLAQLAWWQRETVMVYWPRSQTLFAQACARLGCTVPPPRDIDGLQVEPSDLRQVDGPHKLELKMPLRNRFDVALAYPAIELTLLDAQNNIAVRRILWPQDYVRPGTPIAAGLPPHTTQTLVVRLDTGNAVASNFRVQIFYP